MKRFLWLISGAMLLTINTLSAQGLKIENVKPKLKTEIGGYFNERTGLGLFVKKEIKPNTYLRLDLKKSIYSSYRNVLDVGFGLEHYVPIANKFTFYHGANVNYAFTRLKTLGNENYTVQGMSIGYRLGVKYDISNRMYIGADINPQIGISRSSKQQVSLYQAIPISVNFGYKF
jgi:outer membrane autotransporter protein